MYEGMKAIKPWKSHIGDIGKAIQRYAHINGYSVVEEFFGHGIGMTMHEDPYVFHFKTKEDTVLFVPGMVFTIEVDRNKYFVVRNYICKSCYDHLVCDYVLNSRLLERKIMEKMA